MRTEFAPSYPVSIFIAGDYFAAVGICQRYCDTQGFCVTVTQTTYVYTDGREAGVIIGLINYPRFPLPPDEIEKTAGVLAALLREGLGQETYSIQMPTETRWFSLRAADNEKEHGT